VSPFRITAVCMGNICRSPMAEAVLRTRVTEAGLADHVVVDSAGTGAWHIGEDADPRALATLRAAGYDIDHAGRQFDRQWFDAHHPLSADLVLTMDANNFEGVVALAPDDRARSRVEMMRSFDPALVDLAVGDPRLDVPDPYYGGPEGFVQVLTMIERASDGVVEALPTLLDR